MNTNKLKPCPFCGREDLCSYWLNYNQDNDVEYDWYTGCPVCDIGFLEETQEKAETQWNTRA